MNQIDAEKKRLKLKRNLNFLSVKSSKKICTTKYISGLITRLLISIIIFFGTIIFINSSDRCQKFVNEKILSSNISFSKITNWYNKYFGKVLPIKGLDGDTQNVFNEKIYYNNIENYNDGFQLVVEDDYLISSINSGIVVFIGEKENYGQTVIIQGIDETDYWYGNVTNLSVKLYDYVSKGDLIGTTNGEKLYLVFQKNGEYLDYDEVFSEG